MAFIAPQLIPPPPDQTLDILKALRESAYSRWEKRRDYEWKLSFGIWTALAAFTGIVVSKDVKIVIDDWVKHGTLLCTGLIFIAHWRYLSGIITNTLSDLEIQYWAEDLIAAKLRPTPPGYPGLERPRTGWAKYIGYSQVMITFILATAASLAVYVRKQ